MKKIAVASEEDMVTQHFGHCRNFNIFKVDEDKILEVESVDNPGHKRGFLPVFLDELEVDVIVSGGMGKGAIDLFNEKGIDVITGASGKAKETVEAYLAGNLVSDGSICSEHKHHDDCGEH